MKLRTRLWIEWGVIAALATFLIAGISIYNGVGRLDNLFYDTASRFTAAEEPKDIVIIGIDEPSLAAFGKWPWSRELHWAVFDVLRQAEPKAIAFDILLTEPGDLDLDTALADIMAENGNVFLPLQYITPGSNGREYDELLPVPLFANAAKDIGHVNLFPDYDGILRRMEPCFRMDRNAEPRWHLMELVYENTMGEKSAIASAKDCTQPVMLPFQPRANFTYVSYQSLATGQVPSAFMKDKYVLIGATAAGMGDQYSVAGSSSGQLAGVTIMGNYLNTLLKGGFIKPVGRFTHILISLIPSWILLIGFWRWKPRTILFVAIGLLTLIFLFTIGALYSSLWFAPGAALAGLAFIYPTWGWRRLQATSDYMEDELDQMDATLPPLPLPTSAFTPVDVVTAQAEKMTHAISQMRDLRRFVSDTLTYLPDPMLVADMNGEILLSNKTADAVFGHDVEEQNIMELLQSYVSQLDWEHVADYLKTAMRTEFVQGNPTPGYTEFAARNNRSYALRCAAVKSGKGYVRGHVIYMADITTIANAQAEREEVLQLLSHDMRAPQAAILALLEKVPAKAGTRNIDDRIAAQANRTLNLADNFVDMARMKSQDFDPEDILLADLMLEAADGLWPLASARGIEFVFDDRSDDAFILGERSSLFRAITNLFDNAIKYSPDKGRITVTLRRRQFGKDHFISTTIVDEGEGISETLLPELFGKFTSEPGSMRSRVKGIGLGLFHVESVIARHEGQISASNAKTGGAMFKIILPISDEPSR